MRLQPIFNPYDWTVGVFFDRLNRVIYLCPLPMFRLAVVLPIGCEICGMRGDHKPYCIRRTYDDGRVRW